MGMTDVSEFWLRLELAIIKNKKRSLKEFSNLVGVPYQTLVNQRSQGRYPSIEVLAKMAKELGCSIDWLFFGPETPEKDYFKGYALGHVSEAVKD